MLFLISLIIFVIVPFFINLAVKEENRKNSNGLLGVATLAAAGGYFLTADYFGFIYNPDDPNNALIVTLSFIIVGITPMIIVAVLKGRKQ